LTSYWSNAAVRSTLNKASLLRRGKGLVCLISAWSRDGMMEIMCHNMHCQRVPGGPLLAAAPGERLELGWEPLSL